MKPDIAEWVAAVSAALLVHGALLYVLPATRTDDLRWVAGPAGLHIALVLTGDGQVTTGEAPSDPVAPADGAIEPQAEHARRPEPVAKPEPKQEPKPEPKPEAKPEPKPVSRSQRRPERDPQSHHTASPPTRNRSERQQAKSAAPIAAEHGPGTALSGKRTTPMPEAALREDDLALVMTGYYRALGKRLERRKRYPRMAVKQRQQGTVKLRLLIAADGSLLSADIIAASKHRTLNEAATRLARDSSPYPAPPIGANTPLEIRVPISYHLR